MRAKKCRSFWDNKCLLGLINCSFQIIISKFTPKIIVISIHYRNYFKHWLFKLLL